MSDETMGPREQREREWWKEHPYAKPVTIDISDPACGGFHSPPARSRVEAEKAITAVLRDHLPESVNSSHVDCWCGWTVEPTPKPGRVALMELHRAHVASVLADLMADVWDEARDAVLTGFVPESEHEFRGLYPNPYRVADTEEDR